MTAFSMRISPSSIRLARSTSCSPERRETLPISLRYSRIGSSTWDVSSDAELADLREDVVFFFATISGVAFLVDSSTTSIPS
jgi:hypothetical protein